VRYTSFVEKIIDLDGKTRNRFAALPAHSPTTPSFRIIDAYSWTIVGLLATALLPDDDDDDDDDEATAAFAMPCSPVWESIRIRSRGFVAVLAIIPASPPQTMRRVMSAAAPRPPPRATAGEGEGAEDDPAWASSPAEEEDDDDDDDPVVDS